MPTLQPRLNVVLEPDIYNWIARLADQKGLSRSLVARDLLREALELYEDIHWQKKGKSSLTSKITRMKKLPRNMGFHK